MYVCIAHLLTACFPFASITVSSYSIYLLQLSRYFPLYPFCVNYLFNKLLTLSLLPLPSFKHKQKCYLCHLVDIRVCNNKNKSNTLFIKYILYPSILLYLDQVSDIYLSGQFFRNIPNIFPMRAVLVTPILK